MIGELYDGEFENFPREDGVIKDIGLSDEEVDKLLTIAGEMSRVISREKLKEMYPEAIHKTVSNPIGLTREMLGIDQAVVAGRNKQRSIEDVTQYIASELEAEYQRGFLDGAQQLSRQTEKARHNIIKCCLEDIMNTIDADKIELAEVLEEL